MITADQLVAHAVGDYIFQSDWMARHKRQSDIAAMVHAITYALPFLLFGPSAGALGFIVGSHFLIDRFGLARYVVYAKNLVAPRLFRRPWAECDRTGYPATSPDFLAVWLLIIADNILHVLLNAAALRWL
jgi:hypothetical protein